ncbi:MAG: choice-of-anchor D domain-containing protein [Bradyrhizobiaceae bacterium]|nr:choice-of-anchor D domain-containing protein [Bradyrhizobiaceae bacterium]
MTLRGFCRHTLENWSFMDARPRVLAWLAVLFFCVMHAQAQYPAACDNRKACTQRAIRFTNSVGRNAQYIELAGEVSKPRQQAITVEMWVKVERQAGYRVPLGGLWGPNVDYNDVWVMYISETDQLCFEVSPEATSLGAADNTVARADFSGHYDTWVHVAGVFDGATASVSVYINGALVAGPVSNPSYPTTYLKPLENPGLLTQYARCNAMADNQALYRTMLGFMDEMRIWSRVRTAQEILCGKDKSLNGNEAGLESYHRCNELVNNLNDICDATGHNHWGALRAQASNQNNDRVVPLTFQVAPNQITEDILCDSVKTWTFQIVDTSVCGSEVSLRMRGPESGSFSVSPTRITLTQGVPQTVTVTFRGTNVGPMLDTLQVSNTDRCGRTRFIVMKLNRLTELSYSRSSITFDTLLVGCKEYSSIDSTITICNTSDKLGQPRPITISSMNAREPQGYRVVGVTFPLVIPPGQCTTLTVRCFVRDTTNDYIDTIRLVSNDRCQSRPAELVMIGRTQEVISIRDPGGTRRIDKLNFSPTCPGQLSSPAYYVWSNLTLTPLTIDTIIVPPDWTHYKIKLPFLVQPKTGYDPIAIRFRPRSPGQKSDSIIIRTKLGGCTIERTIKLTGRGLDNRIQFEVDTIDFGNVIVGQSRTINAVIRNLSPDDELNVALYVERGDGFVLLSGTGRRVPPNGTATIPVTFRPTDSIRYVDRLCLFETRCYTVDCVTLTGKGILQRFRFSPLVMETENVIACASGLDTVCIVNISGSTQQLSNLQFDNPTGKYRLVDPPSLPPNQTLAAGDSLCVVVEYTPADVTKDRADRAYIRYRDADSEEWTLQMIGTSAAPKIFVTQYTAFGTVEAGDIRQATLVVENTSSLPVVLDSLTIGPGFAIVSTSRPLPLTLQPRDSLAVVVEFRPQADATYNAKLTAYSSSPCTVKGEGDLNGRGIIIELESALSLVNFGYVRPCECSRRLIELLNASQVFDMTVDSIWTDTAGVPGGRPQFFTWTSKYSPTGVVPYTIPPGMRDTVVLEFCPNVPADSTSIEVQAALHVKAHGSRWAKELETFLIGKRALTFAPYPLSIQFPSGVIDTLSNVARTVQVTIPSFDVNPSQDTVQVDSVTFLPDDRVFVVTQPAAFPVTIGPGSTFSIEVRQRPRAPRIYEARMVIHYSKPCKGADTTVLVKGEGFAQPRGVTFSFEPSRMLPDTFGMVSCDTLVVPIHSSIVIDASVVDVMMRVDFDSTQLRLLDVISPLLSNTCISKTGGIQYLPSVITTPSQYGGQSITLKNFCGIDSLNAFAYLRFVTVANNRVDSRLTVDSINFDTEDVILYKLIAVGDKGTVLAFKSEIQIQQPTAFDSVRILECVDRTVTIHNIGDVANTIDGLLDLPMYTSVVSSVPAFGDSVQPGDSAVVTLRFCPRSERSIDTSVIGLSLGPCDTRDTNIVTGYGYAPELNVATAPALTHFVVDTLGGTIGDTIEIPLMIDADIKAEYNGTTYWLNGLNATYTVNYDPRSLKYIGTTFLAKPSAMSVQEIQHGTLELVGTAMDSVAGGELARFQFVVTVPEFSTTTITASGRGYLSDSLQFLDIVPVDSSAPFVTAGSCNISVLQFSSQGAPRIQVFPNPARDAATIAFRMRETVPVVLRVIDANGIVVRTLLDGSLRLNGGEYAVNISTSELGAGAYVVQIEAGVFVSHQPFVVLK